MSWPHDEDTKSCMLEMIEYSQQRYSVDGNVAAISLRIRSFMSFSYLAGIDASLYLVLGFSSTHLV